MGDAGRHDRHHHEPEEGEVSENSIYRWTFRDGRGRIAILIDDDFLGAEARAHDLLCADRVELVQIEEVAA